MELSLEEIYLLMELVESRWDDENHYPNDYTDEEKQASSTVYGKLKDAHKQLIKRGRVS